MSSNRPLATALVATLAAAAIPGAQAVDWDYKGVSASICQPYAPDTTAAELQVTQSGVYNPGTTVEKVICPLPRDMEAKYPDSAMIVGVYYRVLGGTAARLTCTIFVGSSGMDSEAVATSTASGPLVSAGNRSVVWMASLAQSSSHIIVPNTLICSIPAKTQLAGIFFEEDGTTDVVGAPM
jgi:hypothetical protein